MYARQLEAYLGHFEVRQFYFVPYLAYVKRGGSADTFDKLSGRLALKLEPPTTSDDGNVQIRYGHSKTPMDTELSAESLADFNELMENQRLV